MRGVLMVGFGVVLGVVFGAAAVLVIGPRYQIEVIGGPALYTVLRVNVWTGKVDACQGEAMEPRNLLEAWAPTFARACHEPSP